MEESQLPFRPLGQADYEDAKVGDLVAAAAAVEDDCCCRAAALLFCCCCATTDAAAAIPSPLARPCHPYACNAQDDLAAVAASMGAHQVSNAILRGEVQPGSFYKVGLCVRRVWVASNLAGRGAGGGSAGRCKTT